MKGQSRLFLAILFVGILSGCSSTGSGIGGGSGGGAVNPSLPPATDSVSGTVTFKGSPLAGVTITAWATNTNSIYQVTTTDAGGNYVISGMTTTGNTPADFHIWAKKPGYGFYPSVGSGAEVIRADHTGQFVGNGVTDIGIYFTVIHYVALPNASLAGQTSTLTMAAIPWSLSPKPVKERAMPMVTMRQRERASRGQRFDIRTIRMEQ